MVNLILCQSVLSIGLSIQPTLIWSARDWKRPAFTPVTNELSALSMDGYAQAAGGILVQVPEEEAAEAKEFLAHSTPIEGAE